MHNTGKRLKLDMHDMTRLKHYEYTQGIIHNRLHKLLQQQKGFYCGM